MSCTLSRSPTLSCGLIALGGTLLLSFGPAAQAYELKAKTTRALSLYAGPAIDYPQVRRLRTDARLIIHGCLPDYGWCDVGYDDLRGWVDSSYLSIHVEGRFRPAPQIAPRVGVPIVHFSIGPYWTSHYHGQPWFDDPRYAPAIHAWRVRHRVGNTVIEYEEEIPVYPSHRRPAPGYYPPGVYAPPPAYRPPPAYQPPPVYRPAPSYGPSYEPPLYIPPSERGPYPAPRYEQPGHYRGGYSHSQGGGWYEHRARPLPPPVYHPPAYRPAPGYVPPGDVGHHAPSDPGTANPYPATPAHEINRPMPGGRSLK